MNSIEVNKEYIVVAPEAWNVYREFNLCKIRVLKVGGTVRQQRIYLGEFIEGDELNRSSWFVGDSQLIPLELEPYLDNEPLLKAYLKMMGRDETIKLIEEYGLRTKELK